MQKERLRASRTVFSERVETSSKKNDKTKKYKRKKQPEWALFRALYPLASFAREMGLERV